MNNDNYYFIQAYHESHRTWVVTGRVIDWCDNNLDKNNWYINSNNIDHAINFPEKYFRIVIYNEEDEMALTLRWK